MSRVDFAARRKEAEKEGYISGGDRLKLQEGANRIRLVSECLPHPGEYQGRRTFKWLCYVIDRADGKAKPFFMPHTIYKQIEALQGSDDYGFEEVPMPYDVTINAKGAGTRDVEYSVVPARKNVALTGAELEQLRAMKPLEDLRAALRSKKGRDGDADQSRDLASLEETFDPDEVPF